jgi:hypothetical protein
MAGIEIFDLEAWKKFAPNGAAMPSWGVFKKKSNRLRAMTYKSKSEQQFGEQPTEGEAITLYRNGVLLVFEG